MIESAAILERLIGFPTVSTTPNIELIEYVRGLLDGAAVACRLIPSADGRNANLYAHTGPDHLPGVVLSGHSDVVPAHGQPWTMDPFTLFENDGKLYGRGTADMKGFIACAIRAMLRAAQADLKVPLALALSYDEEIGCIGVRRMLDLLAASPVHPSFCIVGEPTGLRVATGHKGKIALKATCTGRAAHSALAPLGFNAIHLAADFIGILREEQLRLQRAGPRDDDYDIPYSTVHAGVISGGTVLNIVPRVCTIDFEIRSLAAYDPEEILGRIKAAAASRVRDAQTSCAEADLLIETVNSYPGLDTPADAEVVAFVKSLTGENDTFKVAFGTEGGLFRQRLGVPAVVCGPGSMDQGHKPDEYVTRAQLDRCDAMLDALVDELSAAVGVHRP